MIDPNSNEYRCWHEAAHAYVCIRLGGKVEFIEMRNTASDIGPYARCQPSPNGRPSVACAGFAVEYKLYRQGLATFQDEKDFVTTALRNSSIDQERFFNRTLGPNEALTDKEINEFMLHATETVSELFGPYYMNKLKKIVALLMERKYLDGATIEEILEEV